MEKCREVAKKKKPEKKKPYIPVYKSIIWFYLENTKSYNASC